MKAPYFESTCMSYTSFTWLLVKEESDLRKLSSEVRKKKVKNLMHFLTGNNSAQFHFIVGAERGVQWNPDATKCQGLTKYVITGVRSIRVLFHIFYC